MQILKQHTSRYTILIISCLVYFSSLAGVYAQEQEELESEVLESEELEVASLWDARHDGMIGALTTAAGHAKALAHMLGSFLDSTQVHVVVEVDAARRRGEQTAVADH